MSKKKIPFQTGILLALVIVSFSITWVFAAPSTKPLFISPIPTITPGWTYSHSTPTPLPQPVILNITPVPATLSTGLRGYWNLDETNTGDRVDNSSNGNTLTNINGVGWSSNGKIGSTSDFERSSSQYLKIESYQAVGLNFDYSFTLVGWIKRESTGSDMILVSKYDYGNNNRAYRFQVNSSNKLRLIVSPDGTYSTDYSVIGGGSLTSTSNWYHVAAVFDAGTQKLKLYLNGNLDAEKTVTYNTVYQSNAPFAMGANFDNGQPSQFFDGLMDEWRVYTRVLSQSEIQALMNE